MLICQNIFIGFKKSRYVYHIPGIIFYVVFMYPHIVNYVCVCVFSCTTDLKSFRTLVLKRPCVEFGVV